MIHLLLGGIRNHLLPGAVIKAAGYSEMLVPIHRTAKRHGVEGCETDFNPFQVIKFSELVLLFSFVLIARRVCPYEYDCALRNTSQTSLSVTVKRSAEFT